MVSRQARVKGTGTRKRADQPTLRRARVVAAVHPERMQTMNARLEVARRSLQVTSRAAARFARSSMHEMNGAVKASREPMTALWRNVRLAGRHILRDATAAWNEVVPARKGAPKVPSNRGIRRSNV
jgi:hypothetical protein